MVGGDCCVDEEILAGGVGVSEGLGVAGVVEVVMDFLAVAVDAVFDADFGGEVLVKNRRAAG